MYEFILIPAVEHGNHSVFIARFHHMMADGMSLIGMILGAADDGHGHTWGSFGRKEFSIGTKLALTASAAYQIPKLLLRQQDKSIFNAPLQTPTKRHFAISDVAVSEIKKAQIHLKCTFNDVLLVALTGALRQYSILKGTLPKKDIHIVIPVNWRTSAELENMSLGNNIATIFLKIPMVFGIS